MGETTQRAHNTAQSIEATANIIGRLQGPRNIILQSAETRALTTNQTNTYAIR